jgi:hypothetical protein
MVVPITDCGAKQTGAPRAGCGGAHSRTPDATRHHADVVVGGDGAGHVAAVAVAVVIAPPGGAIDSHHHVRCRAVAAKFRARRGERER